MKGNVGDHNLTAEFLSHTHSGYSLVYKGHRVRVEFFTPEQFEFIGVMAERQDGTSEKEFLAPMPGSVISVDIKVGDTVEPGQKLGILEAMKMRNELIAIKKGKVIGIHVKAGESVQVDQQLFEFE